MVVTLLLVLSPPCATSIRFRTLRSRLIAGLFGVVSEFSSLSIPEIVFIVWLIHCVYKINSASLFGLIIWLCGTD